MGLCSLPTSCLTWWDPVLESINLYSKDLVTSNRTCAKISLPRVLPPVPHPHGRLLLTHASAGDPQTFTVRSCSVSCRVTYPFPWVLVHTKLCVLQESVSLVLWKFCNQILLVFRIWLPGNSQSFGWIPRLGSLMWGFELSSVRNSFGIIVLQFVSCPPGGCRIQFYSNYAPPTISL